MRNEFISELGALARQDRRIVLLTGDLGFTVLDDFAGEFPDRFFNVGVAEQNMMGLATGLAEAGFLPFAYSIATFASMRGYEFIRNGAVLNDLPVRIVGVGSGFDYGHNGLTHYALEDIALMRAQPGLTIIAPADTKQVQAALHATFDLPGPVYYRIGKGEQLIRGLDGRFEIGHAQLLGNGEDVAFVALGSIAGQAVAAQSLLAIEGISSVVAVVSCVSPPPVEELIELASRVPLVVSVESHYENGGIGSLVAEVIAESGVRTRLVRRAVRSVPRLTTGSEAYLNARLGLSAEALAEVVRRELADPIHPA